MQDNNITVFNNQFELYGAGASSQFENSVPLRPAAFNPGVAR